MLDTETVKRSQKQPEDDPDRLRDTVGGYLLGAFWGGVSGAAVGSLFNVGTFCAYVATGNAGYFFSPDFDFTGIFLAPFIKLTLGGIGVGLVGGSLWAIARNTRIRHLISRSK